MLFRSGILDMDHYPEDHVQNLTISIPKRYGVRNTGITILFHTLDVDCETESLEFIPVETLDGSPVVPENLKTYRALDDREIQIYGENICTLEDSDSQASTIFFFENIKSLQVMFYSPSYDLRRKRFDFQVFHMEETRCRCNNGEAVENADCRDEGIQNCLRCDHNYHLIDVNNTASFWYDIPQLRFWAQTQECVLNRCLCDRGYPTKTCDYDFEFKCEACHSTGDTVDENNLCVANLCTCDNGTQTVNHACEDDGSEDCAECLSRHYKETRTDISSRWYQSSSHYFSNKDFCLPNACTCENGTPFNDEPCFEHQMNHCEKIGRAHV